jgi:hypothetical protein
MVKAMDAYMWSLHVTGRDKVHPAIWEAAGKVESEHGIVCRNFRKKELQQEVTRFLEVYNTAWERNWGFVPLSEQEVRHYAKQQEQDRRSARDRAGRKARVPAHGRRRAPLPDALRRGRAHTAEGGRGRLDPGGQRGHEPRLRAPSLLAADRSATIRCPPTTRDDPAVWGCDNPADGRNRRLVVGGETRGHRPRRATRGAVHLAAGRRALARSRSARPRGRGATRRRSRSPYRMSHSRASSSTCARLRPP